MYHPVNIDTIALPGGCFHMGSLFTWPPDVHDHGPRRRVRLSPFAIGRTPVTRRLYRSLIGTDPLSWAPWESDTLPATDVSWEEAVTFCNRLSQECGHPSSYHRSGGDWECDWTADGYRLPTEAEWEYACRAGTRSPWFWSWFGWRGRRYAWYAVGSLQPVALRQPNPWELHDMVGNCWEWCWDWHAGRYPPQDTANPHGPHTGSERVLRGGAYHGGRDDMRSRVRWRCEPHIHTPGIGFRLVRGTGAQ